MHHTATAGTHTAHSTRTVPTWEGCGVVDKMSRSAPSAAGLPSLTGLAAEGGAASHHAVAILLMLFFIGRLSFSQKMWERSSPRKAADSKEKIHCGQGFGHSNGLLDEMGSSLSSGQRLRCEIS